MLGNGRAAEANAEGAAALAQGELGTAEARFREAIAIVPDLAAPWFNLSLVHKRRHDWEALLETSRIAAALDQENEGALWNQGIAAAALAKGGRVTRELDHSHHRLAVVFQVWWSSGSSEPGNNEERAKIVVDRLSGPEGPLAKYGSKEVPPAWEIHSGWDPPPLRLGACFDDIVAGVAAVQKVLRGFDAQVLIDVIEAWRDEDDPLAILRSAPRQMPPQP